MLALDRADLAVRTACASLLVAAVSLSWQIYNSLRVDRARIIVTVAMDMGLLEPVTGEHLGVVVVTATNAGKRAAEVSFLALVGVPVAPWYRRITPGQRRAQQGILLLPRFDDLMLPQGRLPTTLDVGGSTQVMYWRDHVDRLLKQEKSVRVFGTATTTAGTPTSKAVRVAHAIA